MKILFLGNNWVGWQVLKWLIDQKEDDVVGLVIHSPNKLKYGEKIIDCAQIISSNIFDGSHLGNEDVFNAIKELKPDIGLSILFGYILKPDFINIFPSGIINLHPSFLPYNRGQYPNVWSIIDRTLSGATLHYIDQGIDTGDIIAQEKIEVEPVDTGESLYKKLEILCLDLFKKTWPLIRSKKIICKPQDRKMGTYHSSNDVSKIDEIDIEKEYKAGELIDIIRARTFPSYSGAYFIDNGRKIYMRIKLLYEKELKNINED